MPTDTLAQAAPATAAESPRLLQLYVDGQWLGGAGRHVQAVVNPATGETTALLPHATTADLDLALAAGCSMIIKPAEETPSGPLALAAALHDAGLPAGVLSMVFGVPSDISTYLIASPIIRKVAFTGSTAVGRSWRGCRRRGSSP